MGLRDTYAYAISVAKGKFDGSAQERDGKLHFVGSVKTEDEKNEIWNAIKTIPTWKNDVVADIKVTGGPAAGGARRRKTYTVQSGDTLSKIAKRTSRRCQCLHEDLQCQQGSALATRTRSSRARS